MKRVVVALLFAWPAVGIAAPGDNGVGMNVHHGDPSFIDAASALGVNWVRLDGNWFQLEPASGTYAWGPLDAAISRASAAGLNVFLTLAYTPAWVPRHGDTDGQSHNDPPNGSTEWARFVAAAVTHFRPLGVRHFGMWNEANLSSFWQGTLNEYATTIAIPGASAVRGACADCYVLGPELAHVGAADDALETILAATPGVWDIITHHSYNAFAETGWRVWDGDGFINVLDAQRFPFTRRSLRQILDGAGWSGEVWMTETGYRAAPAGNAGEENLQAIYVRRVLEEQLARAWYTNSFFYEIHDCGPDQPTCTIDGFGLMRATSGAPGQRGFPADYRLKPAFSALRQFILDHPSVVGTTPPLQCGNGLDDDGDGRVDLDDRGCTDPADDDESDDPPRIRITAPRQDGIVVDGDLSDFGAAAFTMLAASDWRGTEPLDGPGDLSARVTARWSPTGLFFGFEIVDDVQDNLHPPDLLWMGDSLQLAFDVSQSGGRGYDSVDDHELNFGLGAGARAYRFWGPASATDDFEVAAVRVGDTTRYEVRIGPAALPSATFGVGSTIGFSFLVNEADGAGRVGWMEWTEGIGAAKVPERFGELHLAAASVLPDAGIGDASSVDATLDAGAPVDASDPAPDAEAAPDAGRPLEPDASVRADASVIPPTSSEGCGCSQAPHRRGEARPALWGVFVVCGAALTGLRAVGTRRRRRHGARF